MGAALTKCLGGVTNDPKKMEMIISKSFGYFDKDKSGYIDAAEAKACANQVLTMANLQGKVKPEMIDSTFQKVAGTDQKLDQAEFTQLINDVLSKAGVHGAKPAVPAAAAPVPVADVAATPAVGAAAVAPQ